MNQHHKSLIRRAHKEERGQRLIPVSVMMIVLLRLCRFSGRYRPCLYQLSPTPGVLPMRRR